MNGFWPRKTVALQPKRRKPQIAQIYADSQKEGAECLNPSAVISEICGFF